MAPINFQIQNFLHFVRFCFSIYGWDQHLYSEFLKGIVHQFYKLGLNEAFCHSDSENLSHSIVSCSKLLKKAKTVTFAKDPKIWRPLNHKHQQQYIKVLLYLGSSSQIACKSGLKSFNYDKVYLTAVIWRPKSIFLISIFLCLKLLIKVLMHQIH